MALWLDRWRERAARKAEEEDLLRAFHRSLIVNLRIITSLKATLAEKGKKIPTTQVDVGVADAILPRFAQVSTDIQLTTLLAIFRHQLHLLNRRLDHLADVAHQPLDAHDPLADIIRVERLGHMATSIRLRYPRP